MDPQAGIQPKGKRAARLLGLAGFGVILIAAAIFFYAFWLRLPTGAGPAGSAVPVEPFARPWSDRQVVLLALGDSVTAGYGAQPGKSYVARLADNPPDEFPDMAGRCLRAVFPKLRTTNVAVSGSNSIQHLESQLPALKPCTPEELGIVVITTGGNDLIHWYGRRPPEEGAMYGATLEQARPWIAAFERRLNTMMERIAAFFPGGCQIFLGNIYDPSDGLGQPSFSGLPPWPDGLSILAEYNAVIARCAERHPFVHLVDIHQAFLGHGFYCAQFWRSAYRPEDPHYWYYGNIEDPNERGYDAIRRLFLLKMIEVFAQNRTVG